MGRAIVHFFGDIRRAILRLYDDDGPLLAAATAYYVGLSFFPLLLMVIAGVGWFLRHTHLGQDAQQEVLNFVANNTSELLSSYVNDALKLVQVGSAINGPLGLATIVITGLAAFAQLDSAFERIWRVPHTGSKSILLYALGLLAQRGRALLLLLALMALVVMVFLAGMVITAITAHTDLPMSGWMWDAIQIGVTLTTNAVVFTLLFRLLPKATVRWEDAMAGGLLTAGAWEIGRQLLAVFIARSRYTSAYGVIGAFLAVLVWCYYAVTIVLLGAEYIQVLREREKSQRPN